MLGNASRSPQSRARPSRWTRNGSWVMNASQSWLAGDSEEAVKQWLQTQLDNWSRCAHECLVKKPPFRSTSQDTLQPHRMQDAPCCQRRRSIHSHSGSVSHSSVGLTSIMPPKKLRSKRSFEGEEEGQVSSMPHDELACKDAQYFLRYHGTPSACRRQLPSRMIVCRAGHVCR